MAKPDLHVVAGGGSNSVLTDAEQQALFFQHKRFYEASLAKKKAADADFRNVCKKAKSELGDFGVLQIKTAVKLESDDGSEKIQAEMEAMVQAARWLGMPIGSRDGIAATTCSRPSPKSSASRCSERASSPRRAAKPRPNPRVSRSRI